VGGGVHSLLEWRVPRKSPPFRAESFTFSARLFRPTEEKEGLMEPTDGFDRQVPHKPALQAGTGEVI